jgi:hypothetical protein
MFVWHGFFVHSIFFGEALCVRLRREVWCGVRASLAELSFFLHVTFWSWCEFRWRLHFAWAAPVLRSFALVFAWRVDPSNCQVVSSDICFFLFRGSSFLSGSVLLRRVLFRFDLLLIITILDFGSTPRRTFPCFPQVFPFSCRTLSLHFSPELVSFPRVPVRVVFSSLIALIRLRSSSSGECTRPPYRVSTRLGSAHAVCCAYRSRSICSMTYAFVLYSAQWLPNLRTAAHPTPRPPRSTSPSWRPRSVHPPSSRRGSPPSSCLRSRTGTFHLGRACGRTIRVGPVPA